MNFICFALITDLSLAEGLLSLKMVYCVAEALNSQVSVLFLSLISASVFVFLNLALKLR